MTRNPASSTNFTENQKSIRYVTPGTICGAIHAPQYKSDLLRSLIISTLTDNPIPLNITTPCDDVRQMIAIRDIIQNCTQKAKTDTTVREIPCGESAFIARALPVPLYAKRPAHYRFTASGSLPFRTHNELHYLLTQLHIPHQFNSNSTLPLELFPPQNGTALLPLDGLDLSSYPGPSSQPISGLLIAAALSPTTVTINAGSWAEHPYVRQTIRCIRQYAQYEEAQNGTLIISCKNLGTTNRKSPIGAPIQRGLIEGDWCAATLWIAATILTKGSITVRGVSQQTEQPAKPFLHLCQKLGVPIAWLDENTLTLNAERIHHLSPFSFDLVLGVDLIPALTLLAAATAGGTTTLTSINLLRNKESDRAHHTLNALQAAGINATITDSTLSITTPQEGSPIIINEPFIPSHDHRMVMLQALLATAASTAQDQRPIPIPTPAAVTKSYPAFWQDRTALTNQDPTT